MKKYYEHQIATGDTELAEEIKLVPNEALEEYSIQLILLERQNKKRLLMARQEQNMSTKS